MKFFPSYTVAEMVGISGHALSKITASMMIISGGKKENIGLAMKFEAKSLKVIGYSRKNGRFWEFSEKAVELIKEYKVIINVCSLIILAYPDSVHRKHSLASSLRHNELEIVCRIPLDSQTYLIYPFQKWLTLLMFSRGRGQTKS